MSFVGWASAHRFKPTHGFLSLSWNAPRKKVLDFLQRFVHYTFMNMEPPLAELNTTPDNTTPAQIEADRTHHRDILNHLIDLGAEMASMVMRQARQAEAATADQAAPVPPGENLSVAFERCARGVRRSIMLYEKLVHPRQSAARNRLAARKRIIRDVEDAIERKAPHGEEKNLHAELLDRLDSPDLEDEIATREIAEIVTDITRDLGIAHLPALHPWKRRIPHDIAVLNACAAQRPGAEPSAELAALLASAPPTRPRAFASDPPLTAEIVARMSDEEIAARLKRIGPIPDS
jgi:hypothetical protein